MPFGWWHEVHSHPDAAKGGLCASVSHFYLPFYCRLADKRTTTLGPLMIHPRYEAQMAAEGEEGEGGGFGTNGEAIDVTRRRRRLALLAAVGATTALLVGAALLSASRRGVRVRMGVR